MISWNNKKYWRWKKKKKELIKLIANPLEGQIVNDRITTNDYTKDENKIVIPINIIPNVNNIVEDIINNTIQANNDQSTIFIEPKMKKIKPKIEKKTTLNEILTNQLLQNAVKDKDDGYLKNTCNENFDMVQKPPMKDLKINLKQKN